MTLLPGGLALLIPWLNTALGQNAPPTGLPVGPLAFLAVYVTVFIAWQLIRVLRDRLTTQQTAILGVLLGIAYVVALFPVIGWGSNTDTFIELRPTTAWTLVIIGTAVQALASWLELSRGR